MKVFGPRGISILEVMIATTILAFVFMGLWAIYVVGYDFYKNSLDDINVKKNANFAINAILYGYDNNGLMRARTISGTSARVDYTIRVSATDTSHRVEYDAAKMQLVYTNLTTGASYELTPEYVQADGGIAVVDNYDSDETEVHPNIFTISGGRSVAITLDVRALEPGTDADDYAVDDVKSSMMTTTRVTGRMVPS